MAASQPLWDAYMKDLDKKCGPMVRVMDKDRTIVDQNVSNNCFYRLISGKVRFEKRAFDATKTFSHFSVLGDLDDNSDWPFFCELSAFGIQTQTSAAVVVDSHKAEIMVIPVETFLELTKEKPQYKILMYENLTKRLAALLRSLHSRTMALSSLGIARSSQVIHNEAVILSWPATTRGTVKMQKNDGFLVLSKNYISFLKKKESEKKGTVSDVSESAPTVIDLRNVVDVTHKEGKIIVRDSKNKLTASLKKEVSNGDVVAHVINTAKKSACAGATASHDSNQKKLTPCKLCGESFCSLCQCLGGATNPCRNGEAHNFATSDPANPPPCSRCGNEGTHILSSHDLNMLMAKFQTVRLKPGALIQRSGGKVERIGYVLEGTVAVTVTKEDGASLELSDVVSGETVGDIGAFMNVPASAELTAGKQGCLLLEIPVAFVKGAEDDEFRLRVYFALIQLMWNRIIRQEKEQTKTWMGQLKLTENKFLEEALLRHGTGAKIDQLGNAAWY